MSLYEKWDALAGMERTEKESEKFWQGYFEKEMHIYENILENKTTLIEGTVKDLSERFGLDEVNTIGFLSGINTSLVNELDIEGLTEDSKVTLQIDFEKLYYNMHVAAADWLYNLSQWDGILTPERRKEITAEYKKTQTVVKEPKIGRNDPCPCGSGKKYKKCCGK